MPQATERERDRNGRQEKRYAFTPIDFNGEVEPDAAPGGYDAEIDDIRIQATSKDNMPMIVIDYKLTATDTDTDEAEKSVGATVSDFIALFPDGDRRGNFGRRKLRQLREQLDLSDDLVPTRIESDSDFDSLIEALRGCELKIWITVRTDKSTGEERVNVQYTASKGGLAPVRDRARGEEEEEQPERRPARRAQQPPRKAQKSQAARRR